MRRKHDYITRIVSVKSFLPPTPHGSWFRKRRGQMLFVTIAARHVFFRLSERGRGV